MTFINALMAFGTLAFAAPLLIHLLYRSRFRVVDWGAMQFLQKSQKSNSRRLQIQQWLLLLLRCLLPILIALAMSRPLVQSWTHSGGGPVAMAILLDDSLSMQTLKSPALTRWQNACDQALEIVRSLPAGSTASITLSGEPPQRLDATTAREAEATLKSLRDKESSAGHLRLAEAAGDALEWLGSQTPTERHLIAFTDFEESDWAEQEASQKSLENRIREQVIAPKLRFIDVSRTGGSSPPGVPTHNLRISKLLVEPSFLSPGNKANVLVSIQSDTLPVLENQGPLRIRLFANNVEVEEQRFEMQTSGRTEISMHWIPEEPIPYLLHVSLDSADGNKRDNESFVAVQVSSPIKVLLVEGDPKSERMKSESDFLRLALAPFSQISTSKADTFACTTIPLGDLNETALEPFQVAVLCNTHPLRPEQCQALHRWVNRGKGLLIFPGDRWNTSHWNQLPALSEQGVRTINLKSQQTLKGQSPSSKQPQEFAAESSEDPEVEKDYLALKIEPWKWAPLRNLSKSSTDSLKSLIIDRYWAIEPIDPAASEIVATLSNGEPWITRTPLGTGQIVFFTTACDADDSNLPSRAAYVPLMQRIVMECASLAKPQLLLTPGSAWSFEGARDVSDQPNAENLKLATSRAWVITSPAGEQKSIRNEDWLSTREIGGYQASPAQPATDDKTLFMVVAPTIDVAGTGDETSLHPWKETERKSWIDRTGQSPFASAQELIPHLRSEFFGREIWTWIWFAALLCFLLEIAVEQSYAPKRSSSSIASRTRGAA